MQKPLSAGESPDSWEHKATGSFSQGERLVARLPRLSSHVGYRLFRPVVMVITRRRWAQLIEGSPISRIFSSSHPLGESDAPGSLDHPSRILTPTKGCAAYLCWGTFRRNKLCQVTNANTGNISDNAIEMRVSHHCVKIYYIFIDFSKKIAILLLQGFPFIVEKLR